METHCSLQDSLTLPNFRSVHLNRSKNKKTNKISGGISVFVRSEIRPGKKFLEHRSDDYIWLKLCHNFLVLIMIFIYVSYITHQKILHIHSHLKMTCLS